MTNGVVSHRRRRGPEGFQQCEVAMWDMYHRSSQFWILINLVTGAVHKLRST